MSRWPLICFTLSLLQACSSQPVVPAADRTVTPEQAASSQPAPTDTPLQWGGLITESQNLRQSTEVQILAFPLNEDGRPETESASIGRFIARLPGYLELEEYAVGRRVTATGRFSAVREGMVAESRYSFPVLVCDELTLWPEVGPQRKPRIHFGFGASSGGRGYGSIGISF
ncbi:MAG: Slp family lipoprotein [Candidatus Thiodiazotropha sp.]